MTWELLTGWRRLLWRLRFKLGLACVTWPCRRCNREGRTSWRVRQAWHANRRKALRQDALVAVACTALVIIGWTFWVLILAKLAEPLYR